MNKIIKLSISFIILVTVTLIIFVSLSTDNDTIISLTDSKVYYSDGEYFYIENNGIYSLRNNNSELLYEVDNCYSLFVNDNNIYLINFEGDDIEPIISILDKSGDLIKSSHLKFGNKFSGNIRNYKNYISIKAVIDNLIFAVDIHEGTCLIFDINNDFKQSSIEFQNIHDMYDYHKCGRYKDNLFIYHYSNNELKIESIIDLDNDMLYPVLYEKSCIYLNGIAYMWQSVPLYELNTYDVYNNTSSTYNKFFSESKSCVNTVKDTAKTDDNIFIISNSNSSVDSYNYPGYDVICIIDTDELTILSEFKTKKGEHVLYVDNEKIMTYHDGKYLTYSLETYKKISSQKAYEIKYDGSYAFQSCGSYIFVFDDNTGEIINRIPIP